MSTSQRQYPRGYWISTACAIGMALGAALGMTLNNVGAGIAIGIAIGAGAGAAWEDRNKDKLRPLTDQERKRQKWAVIAGLVTLPVLVGLAALALFLTTR